MKDSAKEKTNRKVTKEERLAQALRQNLRRRKNAGKVAVDSRLRGNDKGEYGNDKKEEMSLLSALLSSLRTILSSLRSLLSFPRRHQSSSLIILFSLLGLTLSACTHHDISGNVIDPKKVQQLHKGDSQDKVLSTLGSPNFTEKYAHKNNAQWLYIQEKLTYRPVFEPVLTEIQSVVIDFDQNQRIKEIKVVQHERPREMKGANERTEIQGNQVHPLKQIVGNIGRYEKKKSTGL